MPDNNPNSGRPRRPLTIVILIVLFSGIIAVSAAKIRYSVTGSLKLSEASITDYNNFERMSRQSNGKLVIAADDEDKPSVTQSGKQTSTKMTHKKKKACLT